MHVARHAFTADMPKIIAVLRRCLDRTRARVDDGDIDEISILTDEASGLGMVLTVTEPGTPEAVEVFRLGARAGAAMWALGSSGGAEVDVPVRTQLPQRLSGTIHESHLHTGRWTEAFWLATLVSDRGSLRAICDVSPALVRASRTRTDEYRYLYVEGLRLFGRGEPGARALLADSLAKTAPELRSLLGDDWVLWVDRPEIEVTLALLDGDRSGFESALSNAFQLYRRYWERPGKNDLGSGWISLGLSALTLLARRRGWTPETTSDYAPSALLDSLLVTSS